MVRQSFIAGPQIFLFGKIDPDGDAPGLGDLALIFGHGLPEPGPAEAFGLGLRALGDVDQHLLLVDHVVEFQAEPILACPGDARRNRGRAADEGHLGADRRHPGAFDQGALARQVAQARVELAERRLQLGRKQHPRPLGRRLLPADAFWKFSTPISSSRLSRLRLSRSG